MPQRIGKTGEPPPGLLPGLAVHAVLQRVGVHGDRYGPGVVPAPVDAAEALDQGGERGRFGDQPVQVDVGAYLDGLGGHDIRRLAVVAAGPGPDPRIPAAQQVLPVHRPDPAGEQHAPCRFRQLRLKPAEHGAGHGHGVGHHPGYPSGAAELAGPVRQRLGDRVAGGIFGGRDGDQMEPFGCRQTLPGYRVMLVRAADAVRVRALPARASRHRNDNRCRAGAGGFELPDVAEGGQEGI